MDDDGYIVEPRSRKDIRDLAKMIRALSRQAGAWFDIVGYLNFLPESYTEFTLWVRDDSDMGVDHGCVEPGSNCIQIAETIWKGAVAHNGRDRMTLAHELGHLVMHHNVSFARRMTKYIPRYQSTEWQAKAFAGELLISVDHLDGIESVDDVAERFGVSYEAAEFSYRNLIRHKLEGK